MGQIQMKFSPKKKSFKTKKNNRNSHPKNQSLEPIEATQAHESRNANLGRKQKKN